ncbi:uncharacterized protein BO95DRAFT_479140 [Aspergillus brunneoviolaceus CBS 621.78]|uniref:Uncharacterized protein n=1 Tax=Aspergillus brunneoviolaceus CBS 621.78 TaxID=1450534 RepID=A0ACD1GL60_9EURO|nr:hypothetical protein BO95DRAFT_479140 [Aspergillus brunneoviolaceus CBS 621.78]RAH49867.1 hypothetical protein BO95DRAFT_479140 [Aspergillus brunneoviolaceus CBS 621.78]
MENEKMWLGFKNTVSAAYMGHSDLQSCWRFQATQLSHGERESFCTRQHHDGGYVLLVKQGSGFLPMNVGGKAGTELVVDNDRKERGGSSSELTILELTRTIMPMFWGREK